MATVISSVASGYWSMQFPAGAVPQLNDPSMRPVGFHIHSHSHATGMISTLDLNSQLLINPSCMLQRATVVVSR